MAKRTNALHALAAQYLSHENRDIRDLALAAYAHSERLPPTLLAVVWTAWGAAIACLLVMLLSMAACGSSSPTAPTVPTLPPIPPTPVAVTLSGRLTATNGGQGLGGVLAALGATSVTTDGTGAFNASGPPSGALLLSLTGSTILPRTLMVALTASRTLAVDAIQLGGGFDIGFYRQFVRDATESPTLQPLRRWTTSPNLYLQTGMADARTLDMVEAVARAAVPAWSDGRLNVATVERGPDSRAGQVGWLTVLFAAGTTVCGTADVGRSGGTITLYPLATPCACPGYQTRPTVVRHEVGHAMGFYHTDSEADVMFARANQCDTALSARERYHAAIAYSRPVGNYDPDTDGLGTISLAPMRVVQ